MQVRYEVSTISDGLPLNSEDKTVTTSQKHNFVLDKDVYGSQDVADLVCREKSRINQLAKEFNVGTKRLAGRMVYWEFSRDDVEWMLDWFATNGQPRSEAAKHIRESKFAGKDRFRK